MKRLKSGFFYISLTCIFALSSEAAHARGSGNGSGYGGPDQYTQSVGSIQSISLEQIKAAWDSCAVAGDPARGIKSLIQRIYETVYGVELPAKEVNAALYSSSDTSRFSETLRAENKPGQFSLDLRFDLQAPDGSGPDHFCAPSMSGGCIGLYGTSSFGGSIDDKLHLQISKLNDIPSTEVEGSMPVTLTYQRFVADRSYDAWGNQTGIRYWVEGLRLHAKSDRIQFVNSSTKRPTPLVLPIDEFVNCLQTELQSAAR